MKTPHISSRCSSPLFWKKKITVEPVLKVAYSLCKEVCVVDPIQADVKSGSCGSNSLLIFFGEWHVSKET